MDFSELDIKKTSWASTVKITKSLLPHLWPANFKLRLRVVFCLSLLVGARAINVYIPVLYKNAIDALPYHYRKRRKVLKGIFLIPLREKFPLWTIVLYGALTLIQKSMGDIRDTVFQNVIFSNSSLLE